MLLNRASSVGNTAFDFVTLRKPRLKFSMEFVVYIIFLISAGYLKNVDSCGQLFRHEATDAAYFFPHTYSSVSKASKAISSDGA